MHNAFLNRVVALLVFLLLTTSVFAVPNVGRPSDQLRRTAPQVRNPFTGETNAKRLARGLPPLPPVRRGSKTDTAKRSTTSNTVSISNTIQVTAAGGGTIGFLQLDGAQTQYIVGSASSPSTFTATVFNTGVTTDVTFTDTGASASHPFLAGLIAPGVELQSTNTNSAILGDAPVQTAAGSTPQSGGSPSIPGTDYETAIWSYDSTSKAITPSWVNNDGTSPAVSIVWDPVGATIHLTANPSGVILSHPGSVEVEFTAV